MSKPDFEKKTSNVLVADDMEENLELIESLLYEEDFNLNFAKDGKEALEFTIKNIPDLVLLDIMMPGLSGIEVCEKIKKNKKTKDIPVIFITSLNRPDDVIRGLKAGAVDYISKPFIGEELILKINTHLTIINQRKKIAENQAKLQLVLDTIPDLIFYKDTNSVYTGINKSFADYIGQKEKDILGKTDRDFYEKEKFDTFFQSDRKVIEKGESNRTEEWTLNAKGEKVFYDTIKLPLKNEEDKTIGILAFSRDLTIIKLAEEQLKLQEERLRNIYENANEAIFVLQDNKIKFFNSKLCEILNTNQENIIEQTFTDFVHEKDIQNAIQMYNDKSEGKKFGSAIILRIKNVNKETIYAKINSTLIDWNNKKAILVLMDDITYQIKIEKKLKKIYIKNLQTKNFLRKIIDSTNDIIFAKDNKDKYLVVNKSLADFLSLHPSKIKGYSNNELYEKYKFTDNQKKGIENITNFTNEYDDKELSVNYVKLITTNGDEKIVNVQKIIINGKKNKSDSTIFFARDITRMAKAENSLIEVNANLEEKVIERTKALTISEKNFRNLFDKSNDALLINKTNGDIIDVNEQVIKMLGYSKDELKSMNTKDIMGRDYRIYRHKLYEKINDKDSVTFETINVTKNGDLIPVEIRSLYFDYYGEKVVFSTGRDISERKKAEEIKLQTIVKTEEKERNRFAKDLHDGLGATLSATKMYLNIAKRSGTDTERGIKMLDESISLIEKAIKNAKEIAVNILPHDLEHFGLKASLEGFCERLNKIGSVIVEFSSTYYSGTLSKEIELQVFRIVNELVNNTLKYASATKISIDLDQKRDRVFLYYRDNGKGFDYYKIMNSNKPGIGLNNIIERTKLSNGESVIKSEPGKGMNAKIYFVI